jgi:hypothetical protein
LAKRLAASTIILALLVLPAAPIFTSAQQVFDIPVAGPFHASLNSFPSITIGQGGRPHLVWQDFSLGRVHAASYGRESGAIENILEIDDLGGLATYPYPKIIATGPNIFTAWIDCCGPVGGSGALPISYSTDSGETYSRNLFAPVQNAWEVDIATDGAFLHIVWRDSQVWEPGAIMFSRLVLGTTSFTGNQTLAADKSINPAVTVEKPNVYVAWVNDTGSLFLRRSTDNGQTFGSVSEIDSGRSATRSTPRLVSRGANVYLVWQSEEADGVHLRFAASTDNATLFGESMDIDETPGFRADLNPFLSIGQDDNLYLSWISYKFYIDSGLTIRAKKAPLSGGSWEEFDIAARKTGKTDHIRTSIVADSSSNFFVLYELSEQRQGSQFSEVRLTTSLPITSPAYWLGQLFGHPIVGVALAAAALAGSAGAILFLYRRQYGLKPGPSRVFGFLARSLRGRRRPRKE